MHITLIDRPTHDYARIEAMTNTEFVTDLMERSKQGPLMQLFIIDALGKWAGIVAAEPPMVHGLLDGDAWKRCAVELKQRLDEKYGSAA